MKTNDYNFFVKNIGRIGKIFLLILIMNFGFSHFAKATDISVPTTFTSLDPLDGAGDDVYNVIGDLHILAGGSITGPGGAFGIKINVSGNLIIDIGSSINGDVNSANLAGITIDVNVAGNIILHGNGTTGASITSDQIAGSCTGGHGGNITLVAGGNFTTESGSFITSDSRCSAGFIYIRANGIVDIDGLVESHAFLSGTGANQAPGGGPVTIIGGNSLTVSDSGVVSSRGQDPGADLVHLEACEVTIYGLVQSTGVGHALPDDSVTHVVPPYRPEKDPNSTAGVEVWAGSITINSVPPHKGEVKADLTSGEGSIGWIDLFAQNDINIIGDITGNFAVHANNGGSQNQGGFISVKSISTIINATGRAFQANGAFGGSGGSISLEANNKLTLGGVEFDEATGVSNDGGTLILKSFNDSIASTLAVVINVTAPTPGTVTRTACLGIGAVTIIPNTVVPSDNFGPLYCGGNPAIFPEDSLPESCTTPPDCDHVTISGPSPVCPNSSGNIYTASISGACSNLTHHWTISGLGTIVGSSTGSSISVTAGTCGQFVICDTITCDEGQVTCCRTIDVVDTVAPAITCPTVSDVECPGSPNFGDATATDACDPTIVPTFSDVSTPGNCPQEYSITRTWTATDDCSNSSTCSRTINVTDNTAPTISCPTVVSPLNCPGSPDFGNATATDLCDPDVVPTFSDVTSPGCEGGITRTWTATDDCGNSSTCSRTILVNDNTAPTITCPTVSDVECPNAPDFGSATASDLCDPSVVPTFSDVSTPGGCSQEYSITRTWTATDDCSNSSTCSRTISVTDNTAPTITCPNPASSVECPNTPYFGAATASDLCDQSVVPTFSNVTTPGNCPQEYSVTRTWTATDDCSNSSTCSRTISVTDNTAPSITCPTVTSPINCPNTPVFGSASASDICDSNVPVNYSDATTPACGNTYSKTRTWTATDDCGNSSTCSRTINVIDNSAPTITCPSVSNVECPATPNFGAATASDVCDPSVVPTFSTVTTPGTCPQEYSVTRTWTATDDCNNTSTCSRTINVTDDTAPVISCPPNTQINGLGTETGSGCVDFGGGGVATVSGIIPQVPNSKVGVDFRQPRNQGHPVAPLNWTNGINCLTQSEYFEGMGVPQRIILTGLKGTSHTLKIRHEAVKHQSGDRHAYDFMMSWNQAIATAGAIGNGTLNELLNLNSQTCNGGISNVASTVCTAYSAFFPPDTRIATANLPDTMGNPPNHHGTANVNNVIACFEAIYGNRTIEIRGNTAITAFSITFNGYSGTATGDNYAWYTINWTSTSKDVEIKLAGRPAAGQGACGYGSCFGAANISGGPYHFKLDLLDGASLGDRDNQVMVTTPLCNVEQPVTFGTPTATDACDQSPDITVILLDSISYDAQGAKTHCRKWRATDDCSNSSECMQCIRVFCGTANRVDGGETSSDEPLFTAYPNPTSGNATVVFRAPSDSRAVMDVYDVTGALVSRLFNSDVSEGVSYSVEVNSSLWSEGIYFIRLSLGDEAAVSKLVVMKE